MARSLLQMVTEQSVLLAFSHARMAGCMNRRRDHMECECAHLGPNLLDFVEGRMQTPLRILARICGKPLRPVSHLGMHDESI